MTTTNQTLNSSVWGFSMGGLITERLIREHPGIADLMVIDGGVSNLLETYATIPVGGIPFGCLANDCLQGVSIHDAIQAEYGDPVGNLAAYVEDSPAISPLGGSLGLRGAYVIQAIGDPYVSVDGSLALTSSLAARGVQTSLYLIPTIYHVPWGFWLVVAILNPQVRILPITPGVYDCSPLAAGCVPVFLPVWP